MAALLLLAPLAAAHAGHDWHALAAPHSRRQSCPTIAPPAGFTDLMKSYPPPSMFSDLSTIPSGPLSGDQVATNLYNSILNNAAYKEVMAFPPQGSNLGDFSNVTYDGVADPHCWWTYSTCHAPKQSYLAEDTWICPEPNTWGLTFDDGPYCDHDEFYDFLSERSLKATLFYIGTNIANNPTQAQRGLRDGHEICVHTWSHHYMTTLTNSQVFAELYYTKKLIKDVLGVTATCWRPPFGDVDDRVRTWAIALGMRTVIWNHDTFDWSEGENGVTAATVQQNYQYIFNNVSSSGGSIILTHELNPNTMSMFMNEWPNVQKSYKNVVPVGSCMNITHPYLETNISFPTFADFVSGKVNATNQEPFVSDAAISINSVDPASTAAGSVAPPTGSGSSSSPGATGSSGTSPGGSSTGAAGRVGVSGVLGVLVAAMVVAAL